MDHGPQYKAQDCNYEIRFLGMEPSPTFTSKPEGDGITEPAGGWSRSPGQFFRALDEAREHIGEVLARYNAG